MQFTTTKDQLSAGLRVIRAVIPNRTTLPVLSHVMIEAVDGTVRLTGTDLDVTASLCIGAEVEKDGAMTIPAHPLDDFAKALPSASVAVTRKKGQAQFVCGQARFNVEGFDRKEFPSLPKLPRGGTWTVNAGDLKRLVSYSAFAASTEESRPILRGVLWERRQDVMRLVATNGCMLTKITLPVADGVGEGDVIVPPNAFAHVGRLFDASETVTVRASDDHIEFRGTDGSFVVARLIEGPYPNYKQVFSKKCHGVATVDRAALICAVKRAGVIKNKQNPSVRLELGDRSFLSLRSKSPDLGEIHDEVSVSYSGEPLSVGFNFNYLAQMLKHQPTDEVRIRFGGPSSATTLEPVGWDDPASYVQLLMPLRLEELL